MNPPPALFRLVIIGLILLGMTYLLAGVLLAISRRADTAVVIAMMGGASGPVAGLCGLLANGNTAAPHVNAERENGRSGCPQLVDSPTHLPPQDKEKETTHNEPTQPL